MEFDNITVVQRTVTGAAGIFVYDSDIQCCDVDTVILFDTYTKWIGRFKKDGLRKCFRTLNIAAEKENAIEQYLGWKAVYGDEYKLSSFKGNWKDFEKEIYLHGIKKLYHFTDSSNIKSINTLGGLYSWEYLEVNGYQIPRPGGNDLSRKLDKRKKIQDYVRLCFNPNQPMLHVAREDGRIKSPVLIEVDTEVIFFNTTMFSNKNATRTDAVIGGDFDCFSQISFDVVTRSWSNEVEKQLFQAEVLVKRHIPLKRLKIP
jgi:hypothetical protein